ncbi:hypothetical protein Lal_00031931 [Lupinus albus]|nr:hypothetical protein Lal_00031931 [Lupinus albus]
MEKRPHLYWCACSAHCLDLCLEDIGKNKSREIVRPSITQFATKFLQLQAFVNQNQGLKQMFNYKEFKKSKFYKQKNGSSLDARKIVLDHEFLSRAIDILKVFELIVKVLRLMDGDTKYTMGFPYEAIDRSKQSIQKIAATILNTMI